MSSSLCRGIEISLCLTRTRFTRNQRIQSEAATFNSSSNMDEEPAAASNHNASAAFTSTNAASPGQERDSKATLIDVSNNATSNNHTDTDQANVDSWSSILSSISTSKNDLSKTILVLGGPHSGKSTLIKHLSQDGSGGDTNTPTPQDLALGFSYIDIEDEDKEDLLARLSVYQVSSTQSSLAKLASFAINPEKSKDTVVLILLDWLKPWTFLDSLKKWICILKERSQSLGADALDKMKHNVEMHLRSLLNLDPSNTTPTPDEELTPLPEGLLTENLGLRIIVVCTKVCCHKVLIQAHHSPTTSIPSRKNMISRRNKSTMFSKHCGRYVYDVCHESLLCSADLQTEQLSSTQAILSQRPFQYYANRFYIHY